ncbi:MAG: tetratricopeptide repeat protein [Moraxellaceae bacterium]|nr:tetratricopeptide repeat protein [Moraxellaceae bacterium]
MILITLALASCAAPKTAQPPPYNFSNRVEEARNGNLHALHRVQLRSLYMNEGGMTVHPMSDVRNPLEWLQKGVDRGDALSQARMAYYVLYGSQTRHDPTHDPQKALQLALAALSNKTLPLGAISTESDRTRRQAHADKLTKEVAELVRRIESILQQRPLAEKGNAEAAYALSQAYTPFDVQLLWHNDHEFSGNKSQHVRWLRQAAEAGHAEAINRMAVVAPDKEKPLWKVKAARLKTAADNLTPQAMFELGNTFMTNGQEAEALKWYQQAADKGIKPAQKIVLQLTDPTVVRLKAANNPDAMFELGEYFRTGNWEGKDMKLAQEWYLKASAKGNANASYQAAQLSTLSEREPLMKRAAEQGHAQAKQWMMATLQAREQEAAQKKQAADTARQQQQQLQEQQLAEQKALLARVDQNGSADFYEIELYCNHGGKRCQELRNAALRAQAQRNREGVRAASGQDENTQRQNEAMRKRSECLRKQVESLERYNRGQQSWHYTGEC